MGHVNIPAFKQNSTLCTARKYSQKKKKNAMIYILRTVGTETETYSNLNETFVTDARNLPGHLF